MMGLSGLKNLTHIKPTSNSSSSRILRDSIKNLKRPPKQHLRKSSSSLKREKKRRESTGSLSSKSKISTLENHQTPIILTIIVSAATQVISLFHSANLRQLLAKELFSKSLIFTMQSILLVLSPSFLNLTLMMMLLFQRTKSLKLFQMGFLINNKAMTLRKLWIVSMLLINKFLKIESLFPRMQLMI